MGAGLCKRGVPTDNYNTAPGRYSIVDESAYGSAPPEFQGGKRTTQKQKQKKRRTRVKSRT